MSPLNARLDEAGNRLYSWTGRGELETFYSVTTLLALGVPKYWLPPWYAKTIAELVYEDVNRHGKRALGRWSKSGKAFLADLRSSGAKLEKADETPRGLALRWLKAEPERIRDTAAERGTAIHAASEDFVLSRVRQAIHLWRQDVPLPEWPDNIRPYMGSVFAWIQAYRPRFEATEATVYHRRGAYAGTLDALVWLPTGPDGAEELWIIDYKSGNHIQAEVAMQLAAYAHGEFIGMPDGSEVPLPAIARGAVLHLTPKGRRPYRFREVRIDERAFRSFQFAREIARWSLEDSKTALLSDVPQNLELALKASLEVA